MTIDDDKSGDPTNVIPIGEAKRRRTPAAPPTPAPSSAIEGASAPSMSEVDMLVGVITTNAVLFSDESGTASAQAAVGEHREVMRLDSKTFRTWFDALLYASFRSLPPAAKRKEALSLVDGLARFGSLRRRVHLRVAQESGAIFVDLTNGAWETVRITADGWTVIRDQPVMFRRSRSALPLARPVSGGRIEELRPFLNVASDEAFQLLVGYLVMALRPTGPYPIAALCGEQGASKSTAARVLRALVDPSKAALRSIQTQERDLAVSAHNNWVLAFDNVSGLTPAVSDAICRVATGGGLATRQLFTDADECILDYARPVIINGIDDLATRPDLADRALLISLPRIAKERRQDEAAFWSGFEQAAPRILGALLDGVAAAIANIDSVVLSELPRMADFIRWGTAAEPAFGWPGGTLATAYAKMRTEADADALDRDPVASIIPVLLAQSARNEWTGKPTELYRRLSGIGDEATRRAEGWPRAANALTAKLRRIAPLLRAAGIGFTTTRAGDTRTITIFRMTPSPSSPSSSGGGMPGQQDQRDDDRDGRDDGDGPEGATP